MGSDHRSPWEATRGSHVTSDGHRWFLRISQLGGVFTAHRVSPCVSISLHQQVRQFRVRIFFWRFCWENIFFLEILLGKKNCREKNLRFFRFLGDFVGKKMKKTQKKPEILATKQDWSSRTPLSTSWTPRSCGRSWWPRLGEQSAGHGWPMLLRGSGS